MADNGETLVEEADCRFEREQNVGLVIDQDDKLDAMLHYCQLEPGSPDLGRIVLKAQRRTQNQTIRRCEFIEPNSPEEASPSTNGQSTRELCIQRHDGCTATDRAGGARNSGPTGSVTESRIISPIAFIASASNFQPLTAAIGAS